MQVTEQTVKTIQLTLTEPEAIWLKGYMQNPMPNPGPGVDCRLPPDETDKDRINREKLFAAL